MKSFIDFSENLDDKKKQLMQKQRVMQQMERERASRSNQEFQQDKEEKQSRIDQEKEEKKKLEQLKKEIKNEIKQEMEVDEEFGKMTKKQTQAYTGMDDKEQKALYKKMKKDGNFDVKKNLARKTPDEQHTTTTSEEYVAEDDMKGMSVKSGHKRPTKAGAGMTKKGVEAYRRRNPGSKLKTAVTTKPSKLKKGSKAANRRKSYCARSAGQMKKFPKAAKDPNSRLRQARRRWNC